MIRLALLLGMIAASASAQDVVSLNLCSDQLLVLLAPERVAALSTLARDPALSFVAGEAAHLPQVRADAEAVLQLRPRLVLAGQYGAQTTLAALERHGLPVLRLDQPQDFGAIAAQVREVARALGVPERGESLLRPMEEALAKPAPGEGRLALLWGARGWSSGAGSLGDAVLRASGWRNASSGRQIGLEALLAHPPEILITPSMPRFPSLATDLLRHPALAGLRRREVPPALLICGGPFTAEAVRLLAE